MLMFQGVFPVYNKDLYMLKRYLLILLSALPLVSTSGCSRITLLRIEELKAVESRIDSTRAQLSLFQDAITKQQKDEYELIRLLRADQQLRFSEIDRKVESIAGNLSESQQRLSQIDKKTQEFKSKWEEKAKADSLAVKQKVDETAKFYQLATDDFNAKRYELAIGGFKDFKVRYPESPLIDEATYFIAESYYLLNNYQAAEEALLGYIKTYPQGKKICSALHKLGLVFELAKKDKSRDMVFKKLLEQCPDSDEATILKNSPEKEIPPAKVR